MRINECAIKTLRLFIFGTQPNGAEVQGHLEILKNASTTEHALLTSHQNRL